MEKVLRFFGIVVIVTALVFTFTTVSEAGKGKVLIKQEPGRGEIPAKVWAKLSGPLQDAVKEDYTNSGVLFIYELSRRLGKPCVVNLGFTVYLNLHMISMYPGLFPADGTGASSLEIEGWNNSCGPGHIPVKSAGNYGHWNAYTNSREFPYKTGAYHAEAQLSSPGTHILQVPDYAGIWASLGWPLDETDYPVVSVGMWYESPVQVTFISPNGNTIGPMVHGTSGTAADNTSQDGAIEYVLDNDAASNGHYYGTFKLADFSMTRFYPEPGEWQVLVEPVGNGTGNVDMWCCDSEVYLGNLYPLAFGHHPIVIFKNGTHAKYIIDEAVSLSCSRSIPTSPFRKSKK